MQIAENNWVRRIGKVTQEDRRKMKELREETGMTKHLKMKVVGSRTRWAGHVQRMGKDRMSKKSMESRRGWQKKKRKTKAAMKRLCQTRSGKAGMNSQDWKTTAEDRGRWRALTMLVEGAIK